MNPKHLTELRCHQIAHRDSIFKQRMGFQINRRKSGARGYCCISERAIKKHDLGLIPSLGLSTARICFQLQNEVRCEVQGSNLSLLVFYLPKAFPVLPLSLSGTERGQGISVLYHVYFKLEMGRDCAEVSEWLWQHTSLAKRSAHPRCKMLFKASGSSYYFFYPQSPISRSKCMNLHI